MALVSAELLGHKFRFETAPGLFSAGRIDDGTKLLLAHLPETEPRAILDVGCGYGALGLPVAARFPEADVTLVDRDLLAVEMSRRNATHLPRVRCVPSLGYRDVIGTWDWILCNIPARIGPAAIRYLLGAGARRLRPNGEVRVVVINDLGPIVEQVASDTGWPIERVAEGSRHRIYRLTEIADRVDEDDSSYQRDMIEIPGTSLRLERPQDISEEPAHLKDALPLLLECLPRPAPPRAFVWRGGFGAAATALAKAGSQVVASGRDLLATTFTRRNCAGLPVEARDALWPHQAGQNGFELAVCESFAPAGEESAIREVAECLQLVASGGQVLWLATGKDARAWLPIVLKQTGASGGTLAARGAYAVVRLRPRRT